MACSSAFVCSSMCNRSGGNSSSWIYRGGNICSDLWELPATSFPEPWPSKIQKQPTSIASRSNRSNSSIEKIKSNLGARSLKALSLWSQFLFFSFWSICPNDQSWWSCTQSLIIGPRIVRRQFVSFVIFTGPCTTTTAMPLDLLSFCFCCVFFWLEPYFVLCHFHQSQHALAPQLGLCLYTIRFVFVVCFLDCLLILLFFIFTNNQRFQQKCN